MNLLDSDGILVLTSDEDKKCSRCGRPLPTYGFSRRRDSKDFLQAWCKRCQAEYKKERAAHLLVVKSECSNLNLHELIARASSLDKKALRDQVRVMKAATSAMECSLKNKRK